MTYRAEIIDLLQDRDDPITFEYIFDVLTEDTEIEARRRKYRAALDELIAAGTVKEIDGKYQIVMTEIKPPSEDA